MDNSKKPTISTNGKGSKPRNCFSKKFKENYDSIDWNNKKQMKTTRHSIFETNSSSSHSISIA